ncbi:calcium-binding protein [Aliiroseovarius lamellibrachiae]|uniref:calcium-binding protein n=1 Tax=Aliiroseovarius lamellibrachiae TaxID=1924933 RepID=UPI001BE029D3|nr:calcium-binding protein [Aliiroseovarius lamellibrachiae]MBT2132681.1 hypothetical protein [Aliiroseovarius lamellibrachiae]
MLTFKIEDGDNLNGAESGNTITLSHFGMNFVAEYERIGDQPWEKYDEVVASIGPGAIRYPGGSSAEENFDIKNPNASEVTLSNGATRKTMGAYDFASYCKQAGLQSTFIIPTHQLLKSDPNNPNRLVLDPSLIPFVREFVSTVLELSGGSISSFEIGNEYETYMDNKEYGQLANELAPIIQDEINKYKSENAFNSDWDEPEIAVQVWTWVAQDNSSVTTEDLGVRAHTEFGLFSNEALQSIDSLVTHWYAKDRSGGFKEAYWDLEKSIQNSLGILSKWEDYSSNDVSFLISEWNTHLREDTFYGLAQVPIVVKMFTEFVQAGMDKLNFWSTQYHGNALALDNGTLTAVGEVFAYLSDNATGMAAYDLSSGDDNVGSVAYFSEEEGIVLISNLSSSAINTDVLLNGLDGRYHITSVGVVGVDTTTADGAYRNYTGLEIYNEPDLPGYIHWSDLNLGSWQEIEVQIDPFATVILELEKVPEVVGTSSDDQFFASSFAQDFLGKSGFDIVSYTEATEGVTVSFQDNGNNSGWAQYDIYDSIEGVRGSDYNDILLGDSAANSFWGGSGNDEIHSKAGNDFVNTGLGVDTVHSGWGDDHLELVGTSGEIYAGDGNDFISYLQGGYEITGGNGFDTLSFADAKQGVSVWFMEGVVEIDDSQEEVIFTDIEQFECTNFDDRFTIQIGQATADLSGGNDTLTVGGFGGGEFYLGGGDDFSVSHGNNVTIHGGEGEDVMFSFTGAVLEGGGGDDKILSVGQDQIIFELDDGNDEIRFFSVNSDVLTLGDMAVSEVRAGNYSILSTEDAVVLDFTNGGSLTFWDADAHQIAVMIYLDYC